MKTTLAKWMEQRRLRFIEEEGGGQPVLDCTEPGEAEGEVDSAASVIRRALDLQWELFRATR